LAGSRAAAATRQQGCKRHRDKCRLHERLSHGRAPLQRCRYGDPLLPPRTNAH
jgi:hypothetical protein